MILLQLLANTGTLVGRYTTCWCTCVPAGEYLYNFDEHSYLLGTVFLLGDVSNSQSNYFKLVINGVFFLFHTLHLYR